MSDNANNLEFEAHIITRYLLDDVPSETLVRRYRDAHVSLLSAPATAADESLVAFARRWPWSLGYLDAATGLSRPDSLLRRKVLLMAAILETSPTYARRFEPSGFGPLRLLASLVLNVLAAGLRAAIGVPVMLVALRGASAR